MTKTLSRGIPTEIECLRFMDRFRMPENVMRHSLVVCGVALYLCRRLRDLGVNLDPDLVRAGSLLHDITKVYSFNRTLDHALTGSKVLKKLGYPEIAAIVRQHVMISKSRPPGRISETEIVNYADKRVIDDQIATLEDRMNYIRERYGKKPADFSRIELFIEYTFRLENDIFTVLPGGPAQVLMVNAERERSL